MLCRWYKYAKDDDNIFKNYQKMGVKCSQTNLVSSEKEKITFLENCCLWIFR